METAIHKKSNKLISIYQLIKDLEWFGKEREEFIAPYHEIGNWIELEKKGIKEVKVSFVKRHIREINGLDTIISPHFRIITEGAIENPENESEEHKLAKQEIYIKLIEEKIKLKNYDNKIIQEISKVKDITIEKGVGNKRVDVLVTFEKEHKTLGRGIAFEIQLSPQNEELTFKRSFDRATEGFSIVWIWGSELIKETKESFFVIPYEQALIHHHNSWHQEIKSEIENLEERGRRKLADLWDQGDELLETLKEEINKEINSLRLQKDRIIIEGEKIENKIKNISIQNLDKQIINLLNKEDLTGKIDNLLKEIVEQQSNDIIKKVSERIIDLKKDVIDYRLKNSFEKIIEEKINQLTQKYFNQINSEKIKDIEKNLEEKFNLKVQDIIKSYDINKIVNSKVNPFIINQEERINKYIKKFLDEQLLLLKAEGVDLYNKTKISYYLTCPNCKTEKSIINFESDGSKILCVNCFEKLKNVKKEK